MIYREVSVLCDGQGMFCPSRLLIGLSDEITDERAKWLAAKTGWIFNSDGMATCPNCAKAAKETTV